MKERYTIIHSIYPNYLLLFLEKGKIKSCGESKAIIDLFGMENLKNVNKIVIDNLNIIEKEEYVDNEYELFAVKMKLVHVVKSLYKK